MRKTTQTSGQGNQTKPRRAKGSRKKGGGGWNKNEDEGLFSRGKRSMTDE